MASDKVWFHILETTRILLAHCSLITSTDYQILSILAFNIRNLYRLFGMDLLDILLVVYYTTSFMYFMSMCVNNVAYLIGTVPMPLVFEYKGVCYVTIHLSRIFVNCNHSWYICLNVFFGIQTVPSSCIVFGD